MSKPVALVIGFGEGISYQFAKALIANGYKVAAASRTKEKVEALSSKIGAIPFQADASSIESVQQLFQSVEQQLGAPEVVLFNPSARIRAPFLEINPHDASKVFSDVTTGAFVTAQEAAKRMVLKKKGCILFTGATASVKAFPLSSTFAMSKFAVRALAQSLAKELGPDGIHVVHFIIDGAVKNEGGLNDFTAENIAQSYFAAVKQPPGAWTWELELRSKDEKF